MPRPLQFLAFGVLLIACPIYVVCAQQATLTTLYSFSASNHEPYSPDSSLVEGDAGNFYGTTTSGGANGKGAIYMMDSSGLLTVMHSFDQTDGAFPAGSLIRASDGALYGTTSEGGAYNEGAVFKLTTSGRFRLLHSFSKTTRDINTDGISPYGGLTESSDGSFYGTTNKGGAYGYGTLFSISSKGVLKPVHAFDGTSGGNPEAPLLEGSDGNLYGTTDYGGRFNNGTVFTYTGDAKFTTLFSFDRAQDGSNLSGATPAAGLIEAENGYLYSTCAHGGTSGTGTIYKIQPTGMFTTMSDFGPNGPPGSNRKGAQPYSELIQASDGNLYGTTSLGGTSDDGTIFEMNYGGLVTALYTFSGPDGASPDAALIQAADGSFCGTTRSGGAYGYGTIFRLTQQD